MSWVSCAQNAEDARLHRSFMGQKNGFYIDVGANCPVSLSVTKYFYELGWNGINVEPSPGPFALMTQDRKRDTNLNVGCSNHAGTMILYSGRDAGNGLSTFTAKEVAIHAKNGFKFDKVTVRSVSIGASCKTPRFAWLLGAIIR